jgi:hypothetical protein
MEFPLFILFYRRPFTLAAVQILPEAIDIVGSNRTLKSLRAKIASSFERGVRNKENALEIDWSQERKIVWSLCFQKKQFMSA